MQDGTFRHQQIAQRHQNGNSQQHTQQATPGLVVHDQTGEWSAFERIVHIGFPLTHIHRAAFQREQTARTLLDKQNDKHQHQNFGHHGTGPGLENFIHHTQ